MVWISYTLQRLRRGSLAPACVSRLTQVTCLFLSIGQKRAQQPAQMLKCKPRTNESHLTNLKGSNLNPIRTLRNTKLVILPVTFWNPHTETWTEKYMTEKHLHFSISLCSLCPVLLPSLHVWRSRTNPKHEQLHFSGHGINLASYVSLSLTSLYVISFRWINLAAH